MEYSFVPSYIGDAYMFLIVIGVDMDNRFPEDIARDAVLQINDLFDRLIKERKEKSK